MPQGIGEAEVDGWAVQNLRFDAGWVRSFDLLPLQSRAGLPPLQIHENSNGRISKIQAFEIASSNVDHLLGLGAENGNEEIDLGTLVATKGGDLLGFEGKVVAVLQKELGITHLFE